jgi:hypothetical protein
MHSLPGPQGLYGDWQVSTHSPVVEEGAKPRGHTTVSVVSVSASSVNSCSFVHTHLSVVASKDEKPLHRLSQAGRQLSK